MDSNKRANLAPKETRTWQGRKYPEQKSERVAGHVMVSAYYRACSWPGACDEVPKRRWPPWPPRATKSKEEDTTTTRPDKILSHHKVDPLTAIVHTRTRQKWRTKERLKILYRSHRLCCLRKSPREKERSLWWSSNSSLHHEPLRNALRLLLPLIVVVQVEVKFLASVDLAWFARNDRFGMRPNVPS